MSLRGTIRSPDGHPLGSVDEVRRRLADAYPGVGFTWQKQEPPAAKAVRDHMSFSLPLWLAVFGERVRYPHWAGTYDSSSGVVEFYFEAVEPVTWVRATSYGMTAGLNDSFGRLSAATGWVVKYPWFWRFQNFN
jgi:hypothetical protein